MIELTGVLSSQTDKFPVCDIGNRNDRQETAQKGRGEVRNILNSAKAWKRAEKNLLVKPLSAVPSNTVHEESDSEDSGFEGEVYLSMY